MKIYLIWALTNFLTSMDVPSKTFISEDSKLILKMRERLWQNLFFWVWFDNLDGIHGIDGIDFETLVLLHNFHNVQRWYVYYLKKWLIINNNPWWAFSATVKYVHWCNCGTNIIGVTPLPDWIWGSIYMLKPLIGAIAGPRTFLLDKS